MASCSRCISAQPAATSSCGGRHSPADLPAGTQRNRGRASTTRGVAAGGARCAVRRAATVGWVLHMGLDSLVVLVLYGFGTPGLLAVVAAQHALTWQWLARTCASAAPVSVTDWVYVHAVGREVLPRRLPTRLIPVPRGLWIQSCTDLSLKNTGLYGLVRLWAVPTMQRHRSTGAPSSGLGDGPASSDLSPGERARRTVRGDAPASALRPACPHTGPVCTSSTMNPRLG